MKTINYFIGILLVITFYACDSGSKKSNDTKKESISTVSYDANSAVVRWTAYKLTEKVGVSGKFEEVKVTPGGTGSVEKMLVNGTFSISTSSLNSNDTIRDPKIVNTFFGTFNTPDITGKILSAENGNGKLELKFNNATQTVDFKYKADAEGVAITSEIDVTKWDGGKEAVDALNKVCTAKHTGNDGVSKLWPDVKISVKIPVMQ